MNLEIKIVRIVILVSIFFGMYNWSGQFGSFLTPFIFNYTIVSICAIAFTIRNFGKEDFKTILFFTLAFCLLTINSDQFYLFQLSFFDVELPSEPYPILTIISVITFWSSILIYCFKLIKSNLDNKSKWLGISQILIFVSYLLLIISESEYSFIVFLLFSALVSLNLLIEKINLSEGLTRISYLIFLNFSLEILKLISIQFA